MFLISKIVRGRRLLHELEAQEAKEGGIDLPHLSTKRNQQHRRSSPVLFLEDEDIDASSSAQVAAAARRKITPDSALFLTPDYGRHYHTTSSTPSSPQQGEHRQRMRREAARSQSCRVHPHKRGATPKRSHRISSVASTSIEEEPRLLSALSLGYADTITAYFPPFHIIYRSIRTARCSCGMENARLKSVEFTTGIHQLSAETSD